MRSVCVRGRVPVYVCLWCAQVPLAVTLVVTECLRLLSMGTCAFHACQLALEVCLYSSLVYDIVIEYVVSYYIIFVTYAIP